MLIAQRYESLNPGKKAFTRTTAAEAPFQTNREFSMTQHFIAACEKAGVEPTPRQAAKYRNKKGMLWKKVHGLA